MDRTMLVVVDNHTLGYIQPNSIFVGILHASVLKGSTLPSIGVTCVKGRYIRLASEKDFDDFRVCFNGYNNEMEYKFQK